MKHALTVGDVLRWGTRLLPYVPPRIGYGLCERLSVMAPYLPIWNQVLCNLAHVLPGQNDATLRSHARQVVTNLMKNYYELLRLHAISPEDLEATVDARGIDNIIQALEQGRGVIAAMPHLGNLSLVAEPLAARLRAPIMTVVEKMIDPATHKLLNDLRRRRNVEVVEIGPTVARTIMHKLRRNAVVVLASDRTVASATVEVEFFGAPALVPSGPAALALRTGTPLLTAFTYRLPSNRSMVVIDPPLALDRSGTLQANVRRTMQAIVRIFESYIRRDPSQWLITEPVWGAT
jgi:KDO2-lipid IV(A) lauroyltransferase